MRTFVICQWLILMGYDLASVQEGTLWRLFKKSRRLFHQQGVCRSSPMTILPVDQEFMKDVFKIKKNKKLSDLFIFCDLFWNSNFYTIFMSFEVLHIFVMKLK